MLSNTPRAKHSIAVLDDYHNLAPPIFSTLLSNPPSNDISNISISYFPTTLSPSSPDLPSRLHPFTIICTMRERTPFPRSLLRKLPNLKLLLTTGTRNAGIDLVAAKEFGVQVAGATGEGRSDRPSENDGVPRDGDWPSQLPQAGPHPPSLTTQHTLSLLLSLTSHTPLAHSSIQNNAWQPPLLVLSLPNLTLSLLGFGRLGVEMARACYFALGMRVIAWSANLTQEDADERGAKVGLPKGSVKVVGSKEELIKMADVLSVHYVLSDRSRGILGRKELALMKPTAVLVNASRGPLVDEEALLELLKQGRIKGAALDVFDEEPLVGESEWRTTEWGREGRSDVVLSPHMGYAEEGRLKKWYEEQVENCERWVRGEEVLNKMN